MILITVIFLAVFLKAHVTKLITFHVVNGIPVLLLMGILYLYI